MKKIILGLSLLTASYLAAQTVSLPQGWTNLGVASEASIEEIQNSNIEYVWRFNQGSWEIYSPNQEIMSGLQADVSSGNMTYSIIDTPLAIGDALWVYSSEATAFNLGLSSLSATVNGIVKDAITNTLISDVNISVYTPSGTLIEGVTATTDINGSFIFTDVPGGTYTLNFSATDYNDLNMTSAIVSEEFNVGQIRMIQSTSSVEITVSGELIDAVTGSSISGARMLVMPGFNNEDISTAVVDLVTDASGNYVIENTPSGLYTIIIRQEGYYDHIENITVFSEISDTPAIILNQSMSPVLADNQLLRTKVEWGENPRDLDSHLVSYNVESQSVNWHMYYGEENPTNSDGFLDRDDTDSYGPETITLNSVDNNATYKYYIHNFSGTPDLKDSDAKVDIVYDGRHYEAEIPYETGTVWKVFDIVNGVLTMCETGCMSNNNASSDYSQISMLRPNVVEQNILRKIAEDIETSSK